MEPGDGRGDAQLDDVSGLDSVGYPAGIEVAKTLGRFAYALAKTSNLDVFTLDQDFRGVDVPVVLP